MVLKLAQGLFIVLALVVPRQGFTQPPLDDTERLLEELTNAHGVSGFEGKVREILCAEGDLVEMGQLLARLEPVEKAS